VKHVQDFINPASKKAPVLEGKNILPALLIGYLVLSKKKNLFTQR
jgi:hypothetical protein